MKRHSILALMVCAALVAGCGSNDNTNTGTTPTDTNVAGSDASAGDTTGGTADATTDAAGTDTGGGGTCDCAGKQCGFIPGCAKPCGSCGAGQVCQNNACKTTTPVNLKKFGEACGPTTDCQPPPSGTPSQDPKATAYRACLDAQCETNRCSSGACSKSCTIQKDEKNNATGADGADGIEDSTTNSECTDAVGGDNSPHGDKWACVELASKQQLQQGQSYTTCVPATSWKECSADSDCDGATERCRLYFIYGEIIQRCGPKSHTPKSKTGATLAKSCNDNPVEGDVATCENDLCFSLGCSAFCKTDADCVTDVGACKAGKCANGDTCKSDVDCSAWQCSPQQLSSDPKKYNVCWPKNCKVNGDCPDDTFACRISYNGVQKPEGEPDPEDPKKVKMPGWDNICVSKVKDGVKVGESCDPFSSDDDKSLKPCENPFMCTNGNCSTLCEKAGDCPKDMKCGFSEAPLDLDNPDDGIYDVYLAYGSCTGTKGDGKACTSTKACGAKQHCKVIIEPASLAKEATPVGYEYVANGLCVDKDAGKKDFGGLCGSASTGTGLGKLCNSGYCLNTQNQQGQAQPGFCIDICNSKADCAGTVKIYNQDYKSICTSLRLSWNLTDHPEDDHFIPVCMPTNPNSSLSDCSKDKACTKNGEACLGYAVSMSVDKPSNVEYFCSFVGNSPTQANANPPQPTKNVGEECDLEATLAECKTGYCMPDAKNGKGYCSRVCNADADCGASKDGMFCNKDYQRIPRPDKKNAAIMPLCMKKKSCIPCAYDYSCAGDYLCHNVGSAGTLAKQVCSPGCKTDADCASTDGGAKCVDAKDIDGKAISGKKVCAPSCS
ncbi:MAG: hypothetical protein KC502_00215 [Myxococcales bacterium]|nr:hypothetical protein [Myxococcales bacterium]